LFFALHRSRPSVRAAALRCLLPQAKGAVLFVRTDFRTVFPSAIRLAVRSEKWRIVECVCTCLLVRCAACFESMIGCAYFICRIIRKYDRKNGPKRLNRWKIGVKRSQKVWRKKNYSYLCSPFWIME